MNANTNPMGDKEYMTDSLNLQKLITDNYNNFANECADPNLRNEFLTLLRDEHIIQAQIYDEMSTRGWYPVKQANANDVSQALTKFSSSN